MPRRSPARSAPADVPSPHDRAPLFETLLDYPARGVRSLHTPVHRGLRGPPGTERILTPAGLACDLPSMEATDSTFHPQSCVAEAQRLAADLLGAQACFFLANGSTIGVHAM